MSPEITIINGNTIHDLIHADLVGCTEVVRRAYLVHGDGMSVNPSSHFLTFPEKPTSRIIALPAYLGSEFGVSGIKWIASYPDNLKLGLRRASAVLVLNNYETGYPFALMEGSIISAARTAASAVLAAAELSRSGKKAKRLGFIGNGFIARYVYAFFVGLGWDFEEVVLFDLDLKQSESFKRDICSSRAHRTTLASGAEQVLSTCDVTTLATVAGSPYLRAPGDLKPDGVLLHLSLRDLSPEVILSASNVVDDVDHVLKANTSVHLAEQQVGHRRFIQATLAGVMRGASWFQACRPVVFSPFGLGVLDLAVGKWVFEQVSQRGLGARMADFFPDRPDSSAE